MTMCFFWVLGRGARDTDKLDKLDKLDKIGHTMSRHNRARCGGELHEARHSAEPNKMDTSGAKFNRVWRRKGSFGTGMAHFGTGKGKKHPEKNCQAFPLVLRVKNQRIAAGKQPKNLTRVSPFRGFKMDHSDRQVTRKTPPKNARAFPLVFKG